MDFEATGLRSIHLARPARRRGLIRVNWCSLRHPISGTGLYGRTRSAWRTCARICLATDADGRLRAAPSRCRPARSWISAGPSPCGVTRRRAAFAGARTAAVRPPAGPSADSAGAGRAGTAVAVARPADPSAGTGVPHRAAAGTAAALVGPGRTAPDVTVPADPSAGTRSWWGGSHRSVGGYSRSRSRSSGGGSCAGWSWAGYCCPRQ